MFIKKFILLFAFAISNVFVLAQTQEQNVSGTDTFQVVSCTYDDSIIDEEEWPASTVIEDEANVIIGKTVFHKISIANTNTIPPKEGSDIRIEQTIYNVECNGRKTQLIKSVSGTDRTINTKYSVRKYTVDNYTYYVIFK